MTGYEKHMHVLGFHLNYRSIYGPCILKCCRFAVVNDSKFLAEQIDLLCWFRQFHHLPWFLLNNLIEVAVLWRGSVHDSATQTDLLSMFSCSGGLTKLQIQRYISAFIIPSYIECSMYLVCNMWCLLMVALFPSTTEITKLTFLERSTGFNFCPCIFYLPHYFWNYCTETEEGQ